MKKVAVVILNYNGKKFLEKFLPTVIEHSSDVAEIIVADNASTDGSVDFMRTSAKVRIIFQIIIKINDKGPDFHQAPLSNKVCVVYRYV